MVGLRDLKLNKIKSMKWHFKNVLKDTFLVFHHFLLKDTETFKKQKTPRK